MNSMCTGVHISMFERNSAKEFMELYICLAKFLSLRRMEKLLAHFPRGAPINPKRPLGCDISSDSAHFFQETAGVLHPVVVASAPHQHN